MVVSATVSLDDVHERLRHLEERMMSRFNVAEQFICNRMEQESTVIIILLSGLICLAFYIFGQAMGKILMQRQATQSVARPEWEALRKLFTETILAMPCTMQPTTAPAPAPVVV